MKEPLNDADVEQLIQKILEEGSLRFTKHAYEEMDDDDLDEVDITNVLRGGYSGGADLIRGSWRYRMTTPKICVVIAFRSEQQAVVVTAWRIK